VTAGSVPKKVSDADRKRIADLEKSEAMLKEEVSKLKVTQEMYLQNIVAQKIPTYLRQCLL